MAPSDQHNCVTAMVVEISAYQMSLRNVIMIAEFVVSAGTKENISALQEVYQKANSARNISPEDPKN